MEQVAAGASHDLGGVVFGGDSGVLCQVGAVDVLQGDEQRNGVVGVEVNVAGVALSGSGGVNNGHHGLDRVVADGVVRGIVPEGL